MSVELKLKFDKTGITVESSAEGDQPLFEQAVNWFTGSKMVPKTWWTDMVTEFINDRPAEQVDEPEPEQNVVVVIKVLGVGPLQAYGPYTPEAATERVTKFDPNSEPTMYWLTPVIPLEGE